MTAHRPHQTTGWARQMRSWTLNLAGVEAVAADAVPGSRIDYSDLAVAGLPEKDSADGPGSETM